MFDWKRDFEHILGRYYGFFFFIDRPQQVFLSGDQFIPFKKFIYSLFDSSKKKKKKKRPHTKFDKKLVWAADPFTDKGKNAKQHFWPKAT